VSATQRRVVRLFCDELGYEYLGDRWRQIRRELNAAPLAHATWAH
jgi:hypothetical protein